MHAQLVRPVFTTVALTCLFVAWPSAGHDAEKEKPKSRLAFAIVATEKDDEAAVAAARKWFEAAAKDVKRAAELKKLAEEGQPPPAPTVEKGPRYAWVEIAPSASKPFGKPSSARKPF